MSNNLFINGEVLEVGKLCEFETLENGKKISGLGLIEYLSEYNVIINRFDGGGEIIAHPNTMKIKSVKPNDDKQEDELVSLFMSEVPHVVVGLTHSQTIDNAKMIAKVLIKNGYQIQNDK